MAEKGGSDEKKAARRLERSLDRVLRFQSNSSKSIGRLANAGNIETRLQLLEQRWKEFQDDYDKVCDELEDGDVMNEEDFDKAEDAYEVARAHLLQMQQNLEPSPQQPVVPEAAVGNVPSGIRMKAIEVPEFTGEIEHWVSFRDLFQSIVGNNNTLSDVQRLQHLRVACKGKSAELIRHIELTNGNFAVAWATLVKRYENERLLVSRMIERLLDLPSMTRECPDELSRLLDGTNQTINALRVLKQPVDQWGSVIVVHTVRKLDHNTRMLWERSIAATTDMSTYDALDTFLSGVLRSFEAIKTCDSGARVTPSAGYQRRAVRTHVVASQSNACMMCNGAHALHRCPTMLTKTVQARREFVERNRVCFNCLGGTGHASQTCTSRFRCAICNERHHTLLHLNASNSNNGSGRANQGANFRHAASHSNGSSVNTNVCQSAAATGVLLPTAYVTLAATNGKKIRVRALIDQASEATLITERVVQALGAAKMTTNTAVKGVGGTYAGTTASCVSVAVSSSMEGEMKGVNVKALVMSKVTSKLPSRPMARDRWSHLANLPLADPDFDVPGDIDLLLGANVFPEILLAGVLHGGREDVVAQQTIFGWIVTGRAVEAPPTTVTTMHVQLDGLLRKFWEQEEVSTKPILSVEDAACEALYAATTTRASDGRYVVDLPFRQGGRELGESQYNAVRRLLQMEKRGMQYPNMYDGYREFMRTYLALGHMEAIPPSELDTKPQCYLPHHAVFKPDSTTTKLRVVFDATAATTSGKGLNALLLTGPRLQETLASILLRWRRHRIAISADVEKMYRQIWVRPAHQDYQRIVWRETADEPVQHYRLKTVTYGTASAPYMAVKTMQRLAEDERAAFPRASQVVQNDFYVDDCLTGTDTLQEAIELKEELLGLMAAGGMRLMKWSSNSCELLRTLPDDHIECRAPLSFDEDDGIKALGIRWYPATDEFRYKVQVSENKKMTKREMLSEIARLFDPLGLLSPVIITAKIQVQELWKTSCNWDDELPTDVCAAWVQFQQELHRLEEVRIPRWCSTTMRGELELHGFSDASARAFAACVYARVRQDDGSVIVTLLAAKTKVAPVKSQTIPRLELNGAVLLARLLQECRQALRCDDSEAYAWTDSTTVLGWLRKHPSMWQTFVANRVAEVQTTMSVTQWQHVPGVDNPADVASRGVMPASIRNHPLWWSGPAWLSSERESWPKQKPLMVNEELMEESKKVRCMITQTQPPLFDLATRFSSWTKLVRVTAYLHRMRPQGRRDGPQLHAEELDEARRRWIRLAQENEFGDAALAIDNKPLMKRHRLTKLNPFVDEDGIMRVGGRLKNAHVAYEERHPAILPSKSAITELIVRETHERAFHAGPQATMGQLHQRYWLLCERRRVRYILHKCVTCARARPHARRQIMGDLPAARVRPARPFLHTAVDYAGPLWSRTARGRGNKAHKSWVAVFVCFTTKAVHLELVSELSTNAFLAAYRRFTARRGACSDIYSDNGTNFVGADRELQAQLRSAMLDEKWRAELSNHGTRFHFSPPGSPHFNGLAEAAVKMAKSAMMKVLGEVKLTFEEMATFLSQVEAALNSRPLCALPADGTDESVLTPGHFLIGQPMTAVPEPNTIDARTPTNRWHLLQNMAQHFWRRWSRDYLHQMQQRHKWTKPTPNVKIGDVVLVHDELLHATRWRTGRVTDVHPGSDDRVRVATIKVANGVIKRAVVKLTVLPIQNEEKM